MDRDALNDNDEEAREVLILDPYAEIPSSLRYFLMFGGYEVRVAENLSAACELLKTFPVDMAFLGSRSVADGLIGFLKRVRQEILCFLVTPESGIGAELDAACMGADGHVSLPLTFAKLDSLLERYLMERYFEKTERTPGQDETASPCAQEASPLPHVADLASGLTRLSPTGEVLWADKRLCDALGYTKDELCLKKIHEVAHPDDRQELFPEILPLYFGCGEEPVYFKRVRLIHRDGSHVPVELVKERFFTEVRSLNGKKSDNPNRP